MERQWIKTARELYLDIRKCQQAELTKFALLDDERAKSLLSEFVWLHYLYQNRPDTLIQLCVEFFNQHHSEPPFAPRTKEGRITDLLQQVATEVQPPSWMRTHTAWMLYVQRQSPATLDALKEDFSKRQERFTRWRASVLPLEQLLCRRQEIALLEPEMRALLESLDSLYQALPQEHRGRLRIGLLEDDSFQCLHKMCAMGIADLVGCIRAVFQHQKETQFGLLRVEMKTATLQVYQQEEGVPPKCLHEKKLFDVDENFAPSILDLFDIAKVDELEEAN
jgi:hypothetical protein